MSQTYKTIYFTDFPADSSNQKSLTLGFGIKAIQLFEQIKDLSSEELRQIRGTDSYNKLVLAPEKKENRVNRA